MSTYKLQAVIIIGVIALAMSVTAGYIGGYYDGQEEGHEEPAQYSYAYKVHDPHTGDEKMHHESRIGDVVKGFYTVKEADGTIREVHYTADKHNGFNAEVKKIGHPIPQPVYNQGYHF